MKIKHHSDAVFASRHLVLRAEIDRLQGHYKRDTDLPTRHRLGPGCGDWGEANAATTIKRIRQLPTYGAERTSRAPGSAGQGALQTY